MTIFRQKHKHKKLNDLQNFVTHIMHMLVINHIFISNGLEALNNKRSSKSRVSRKKDQAIHLIYNPIISKKTSIGWRACPAHSMLDWDSNKSFLQAVNLKLFSGLSQKSNTFCQNFWGLFCSSPMMYTCTIGKSAKMRLSEDGVTILMAK